MAVGVLLGGAWQWLFQVPALWREGYRPQLVCRVSDPSLRRIFVLMAIGTVGLAATQVNILINSIFASSMGDGAVSWLGFAFRLMQFPIGVFGVAISTVTLTKVSNEVVGNDW
jgi:putative peptidoglycan lipid II flippase